ncbi:MAG TPA: hypothetical protein VG797_05225 [Phycisphaerales bacterium]|nr:hypothetical protein [Phycisphaerales bacterium]
MGRIIPWSMVSFRGNGCALAEEDADDVGTPPRFWLRVGDGRRYRVSKRLHRRSLDRAWGNGSLVVDECFDEVRRVRRYCLIGPVLTTGIAATIFTVFGLFRGVPPGLSGHVVLYYAAICGIVVMYTTPVWLAGVAVVPVFRHNVRRSTCGVDGITAQMNDGRVIEAKWRDLRRVLRSGSGAWKAEFVDGSVIYWARARHTSELLRRLRAQIEPESVQRDITAKRRMRVRIVAWCFIGGSVGVVMVAYLQMLGLGPSANPWHSVLVGLMIGVAFPALLLGVAWVAGRQSGRSPERRRKRE